MTLKYGSENPALRRAIQRIARGRSENVRFVNPHAYDAMDDDGFDSEDVMECLQKGKVYGPEQYRSQLRCNVIHQGLEINVAVGGLDSVNGNWDSLERIAVVTVMRLKK